MLYFLKITSFDECRRGSCDNIPVGFSVWCPLDFDGCRPCHIPWGLNGCWSSPNRSSSCHLWCSSHSSTSNSLLFVGKIELDFIKIPGRTLLKFKFLPPFCQSNFRLTHFKKKIEIVESNKLTGDSAFYGVNRQTYNT